MQTKHIEEIEETQRFWRHLFGGERGQLMVWTGVRGDDGKIVGESILSNNFAYPGAAPSAAEWALEKAEEGREVYFCTHLLTSPKRRKEYAQDARALWAEYDGGEVPNGSLRPTATIESSPGHYQTYWRLDKAVRPGAAEELNKRIAYATGADPSGHDLTQLLRVPGTVNHKYEGKPLVQIVELRGDRTYTTAELDSQLPKIEEPRKTSETRTAQGEHDGAADEPPVALSEEALKVWRGDSFVAKSDGEIDKSASLMKLARVLFDAGATRPTIVGALAARDVELSWRKYADIRDSGEREYHRIVDKLIESGRKVRVRISEPSSAPASEPDWPVMASEAYNGIFGKIVELVDEHTEGDPAAVLMSALTAYGNAAGRGSYMEIGATRHRTNLFTGIVGTTAKGRKGSSWSPVKSIMHAVDSEWTENRIMSGLSSGEGLIGEVRDPVRVPDKDGEMKIVDQGVSDKRLLVMEGELSQGLKTMKREGNTLSPVMRNAWDGETLRTMVKHSPYKATDPHISVLGHITLEELVRHLTETEMANGLANRFLWMLVRRSKSLPFGGEWSRANLAPVTRLLGEALRDAASNREMRWADDAKGLWCEAYETLTEDRPGMLGAVTARAEAQALRLSMIYALADSSYEIKAQHVESALAVWEYAEDSARYIFGDSTGDPDADKVLGALKVSGDGMTRTEISDLFGRHKSRKELDRIRGSLLKAERIRVGLEDVEGSDKRVEKWRLA